MIGFIRNWYRNNSYAIPWPDLVILVVVIALGILAMKTIPSTPEADKKALEKCQEMCGEHGVKMIEYSTFKTSHRGTLKACECR
jgi:hypothetical protein